MNSSSPLSTIVTAAQSYKRFQRDFQARYEESKRECEQQEQRIEELSKEIKRLVDENGLLHSKVNSLKSRMEHLTRVEEKFNDLNAQCEDQKKKLMGAEADLDRKSSLIQQLMFESKQNIQQCISSDNEKNVLQLKYEKLKRDYNDELEMHEYTREKLKEASQNLASLESHWAQRANDLEQECNERIANANMRCEEAEGRLQIEADTSSKIRLNYQSRIKELEDVIAQKEKEEVDQAGLREKLTALEKRCSIFAAQLAESNSQREVVKECDKCPNLEQKLRDLKLDMYYKQENIESVMQRKDKIIADGKKELDNSYHKCASLEQELLSLKTELTESGKTNKELRAELSIRDSKLSTMELAMQELADELASVQERVSRYSKEEFQARRKQELNERNARNPYHMRDHYPIENDVEVNSPSRPFKKSGNSLAHCLTSPFRAFARSNKKGISKGTMSPTQSNQNLVDFPDGDKL